MVIVIQQYLKPFNCVQTNELRLIGKFYEQNVLKNHTYFIYIYKQDLALNNLQ